MREENCQKKCGQAEYDISRQRVALRVLEVKSCEEVQTGERHQALVDRTFRTKRLHCVARRVASAQCKRAVMEDKSNSVPIGTEQFSQ